MTNLSTHALVMRRSFSAAPDPAFLENPVLERGAIPLRIAKYLNHLRVPVRITGASFSGTYTIVLSRMKGSKVLKRFPGE